MDIYQTEDEQVEALKKWWQENGKSALVGVAFGLIAIFGWREWQDYQVQQAAQASQLYQQMVIAARADDSKLIAEKAAEISNAYKGTVYAVFARMAAARVAVDAGKLDVAAQDLQWALDNTSQSSLQHVIKLRLANVYIADAKLKEAGSLLKSSRERGEFASAYAELEGDIFRRQGDIDAAVASYQKALELAQSASQDTAILDMKLDDLGRAAAK